MVLVYPLVLGLVLAPLFGGDVRRLADLRLRGVSLLYLALALQLVAFPVGGAAVGSERQLLLGRGRADRARRPGLPARGDGGRRPSPAAARSRARVAEGPARAVGKVRRLTAGLLRLTLKSWARRRRAWSSTSSARSRHGASGRSWISAARSSARCSASCC